MQLRPPTPADEPFLDHVRRPEVAGEFNFFEDAGEERAAAAVERLIVALDDGTPIGSVSWHGIPYGPNRRSVAWNVGITIVPEHRGKGYGAAAQRALAEHLFATTDANRVEAATDTENVAEQRALERAGFRREGVLRGAQHRAGGWRDLVLFARLREDAG
ncbi:MAG: GNAT family N-acetyltransferase [Actinomycetota bacterium]|nr:GNAT family N-acetyltransferase [Actinomycetota bacterium]